MSRWTSRKFWMALIAAAIAFGNGAFDWGLTTEQIATVLIPMLAFIFGEAWVDKSREQ